MPAIISSTKLRNEYNEVSTMCHERTEPVFITRNGMGDTAIMSIETYELLSRRAQLVDALEKGYDDVLAGRIQPAHEAIDDLRAEFSA